MTERKYNYLNIRVGEKELDQASNTYKFKASTKYHWDFNLSYEHFSSPKETRSWAEYVGRIMIESDNVPESYNLQYWVTIWKNEKWLSGTLSKGSCYINVKAVSSDSIVQNFEITIVEREPEKVEETFVTSKDEDLPF